MADLYIDSAVLARTRDRLRSIEDLLTRPCREMGALPSEAVAQDVLRTRLREFGDEWSYGIGRLGEFSAAASEALHQVEQAFRDVEHELTAALDQAARDADELTPRVQRALSSFAEAADALQRWVGRLESFQGRAQRLEGSIQTYITSEPWAGHDEVHRPIPEVVGVSPTLDQRAAMSVFASVMAHSVHVLGEGVIDVPVFDMTLEEAFGDEISAGTAT